MVFNMIYRLTPPFSVLTWVKQGGNMNTFSYRTIETRLFNQTATFEVCGRVFDDGKIELTELFAVGKDNKGNDTLIRVDDMLNMPAIYSAIVSLLNEWTHSLVIKNET